jgi:hypothetical protein
MTYTLIKHEEEYDIFSDGSKIFIGCLDSNGNAIYLREIGEVGYVDSKLKNFVRKRVSELRSFKPTKVMIYGTWEDETKEIEIIGYSWKSGSLYVLDSDKGFHHYHNNFVPINEKTKSIIKRLKEYQRTREEAMKNIEQLEIELRNNEVKFSELVKFEDLEKNFDEGKE